MMMLQLLLLGLSACIIAADGKIILLHSTSRTPNFVA